MSRERVQLFEDVRYAVDHDKYMWIVFWGPPRETKTTIAGWMLQSLYKNWDTTLNAFVFNLPQLLYKIRHGVPERWPTVTKPCHMRVPALNYDDFGAHSNKAVTQHDIAWDYFKGGSDVLGTKIGVLAATMVDPTEPTLQLMNKYTHEVQITSTGHYKYDKVEWQQDYYGWKPRKHKTEIEKNTFDPWPEQVYQMYDDMRLQLADEVLVRCEDACTMTQLDSALRFCKPQDFDILQLISDRGPVCYDRLQQFPEYKLSVARLKGYGLLVPLAKSSSGYYQYAMTPLGQDALERFNNPQTTHLPQSHNDKYINSTQKERVPAV